MAAIRIKSLSKSFGDAKVLKETDLTVEEGEIFGLIGPSELPAHSMHFPAHPRTRVNEL